MKTTIAFIIGIYLGTLLFNINFPVNYFVSYVYHTEENGPVAGYGQMQISGKFDNVEELQNLALLNEAESGNEETIKSLCILNVCKY